MSEGEACLIPIKINRNETSSQLGGKEKKKDIKHLAKSVVMNQSYYSPQRMNQVY